MHRRKMVNPNKEQIWGKMTKMGPFWVLSFMKITLVSPSLDQKEQNFLNTYAPMQMAK